MNLLKRILVSTKVVYHLRKKICSMNSLAKVLLNLEIQKKELILVIWFINTKLKKRILEDFTNFQNLIHLFKNVTDDNVELKKVSKNKINFKSDLGEKIGNSDLKSKDQMSVIQNIENFRFKRKKYWYFRNYYFLLSEGKGKAKYGKSTQNINF